jgi:hypothetical protein
MILYLNKPDGDEEPAIIRGSLFDTEAGVVAQMDHDYPDLDPIGLFISGVDLPVYTVTEREGRMLKLEVA